MKFIIKKYGNVTEITEIEKEPFSVRVYASRKRRTTYGSRRLGNTLRTRAICLRRLSAAIAAYGSPLLVTLTFAGDASDAALANDSLRRFQVRLRAKFPHAQSAFVPELSPRGRIHFHGLLFNVPMSLGDKKLGRRTVAIGLERRTRVLAQLWGAGYVDALQTDGSGRLATYITKYITKACNEVLFNAMRMLRISHGFPREEIFRGEVAERMAAEYAGRKPDKSWEEQNQFLGKIAKKTYYDP